MSNSNLLNNTPPLPWLNRLCDPETGNPLTKKGNTLYTTTNQKYSIVQGIPNLLKEAYEGLDTYTRPNIDFYEQESQESYESLHLLFIDNYAYKWIRRIIEHYAQIPITPQTIYLDVGCGYGYLSLNLLAAAEITEYHALDVHFNGLHSIINKTNQLKQPIQVARGTIYKLPYPPQTFNLITGRGVLHHLANIPLAAQQIADKLAPNGYAVFIEPTLMWHWAVFHNPLFSFRLRGPRRALKKLLNKFGLGQPIPPLPPKELTTQDKETDQIPLSEWVLAFKQQNLDVTVKQFDLLAGFFHAWVVFPIMTKPNLRFIAKILYTILKALNFIDHCLFKYAPKIISKIGFFHLIVIHKHASPTTPQVKAQATSQPSTRSN